ncbi:MAG: type II toxin-antitoxin system HicA family toxin [Deltaproteobacteria bacterium]|nr:type II toxin-antitoxin system HicA family toxin [Deltaproteobacteria bacterium]
MSSRLPRLTAKELIRFLKGHGFEPFDSKGSHQHFVHPITKQKVTVPVHSGKIIGPGLLKAILKQAGLEWK